VGYIETDNRGDQVHGAFLVHGDQQVVAVCDLRDDYMDFAIQKSHSCRIRDRDYHSPAPTLLDRQTERAYNLSRRVAMEPKSAEASAGAAFHPRNFPDCVKSRGKCNCDMEICHARNERFTNNEAANRYLEYTLDHKLS
jgi:hypothetical protein